MKKDKWFKWKIAMAGTAGMAFLFHVIKASPDYEAAVSQNASAPATATAEEGEDPVWEEWLSSGSGDSSASLEEEATQQESVDGAGRMGRRGHGGPGASAGGEQVWQGSSSDNGASDASGSETWGTSGDAARTGRS